MAEEARTPEPIARSDVQIVDDALPALRRLAAVICPASVEPGDLIQEAVCRGLARGLAGLDDPTAYLARAVINIASNERRRVGRFWRAHRRLSQCEPSDDAHAHDLELLRAVSPALRAAVFLVDVEGYSSEEASELLGCSSAAVRQRATRGRRELREQVRLAEQREQG